MKKLLLPLLAFSLLLTGCPSNNEEIDNESTNGIVNEAGEDVKIFTFKIVDQNKHPIENVNCYFQNQDFVSPSFIDSTTKDGIVTQYVRDGEVWELTTRLGGYKDYSLLFSKEDQSIITIVLEEDEPWKKAYLQALDELLEEYPLLLDYGSFGFMELGEDHTPSLFIDTSVWSEEDIVYSYINGKLYKQMIPKGNHNYIPHHGIFYISNSGVDLDQEYIYSYTDKGIELIAMENLDENGNTYYINEKPVEKSMYDMKHNLLLRGNPINMEYRKIKLFSKLFFEENIAEYDSSKWEKSDGIIRIS